MSYPRKLNLFSWLVGFFFIWSAATIVGAAVSLFYPFGQQTYGGFYWAWDSVGRHYHPNDAYIHPSLHGRLSHDTIIIAINDLPIDEKSDLTAVYALFHEAAPTCEAIPQAPLLQYTLIENNQRLERSLPLFCLTIWERIPLLLPITFLALFVLCTGWTIFLRHRHQSNEREQELILAISWVIAITAAHIGKQAYNDPGIHTMATYLMGMAVSAPMGVFYVASVWQVATCLYPPSPRFRGLAIGVLLLLNLGVISNALQFFNSYYTNTALSAWVAIDRRLTILLMIFSLAAISLRARAIARNETILPTYRNQGRAVAWATILVIAIVVVDFVYEQAAKWVWLPPPQPLFLAIIAFAPLLIAIASLNQLAFSQSTIYLRWLTFGGFGAVAISVLTWILLLEGVGQQLVAGGGLLFLTILGLRAPYRWQCWLERLTTYRTIRQEDIEQYTAALQTPTTTHDLIHTIPHTLHQTLRTTATLHLSHEITTPLPTVPQKEGENWLLPLRYAEKEIGLLTLGPRPSSEPFHEADRESLQTIAYLTALALQTANQITQARLEEENIRFQERQELGREIHDTTLATLNDQMWTLDLLHHSHNHPTSAQQILLHEAETHRQHASNQLRRIVNNLNALQELELPTPIFLQGLFEKATLTHPHLTCHLICPTPPDPFLEEPVRQQMLLVCKQAFDNALKHAHAQTITITITCTPADIHFTIADNGRGFTPTDRHGRHGLGIMQARLSQVRGHLDIQSTPHGTTIHGRLPLPQLPSSQPPSYPLQYPP